METLIYNTLKSRLETVHIEFTDQNKTWFEESEDEGEPNKIMAITDYQGCLLISENAHNYPILVDCTRAGIGYSKEKAEEIINWLEEG